MRLEPSLIRVGLARDTAWVVASGLAAALLALLVIGPSAVLAAAPGNDDASSATTIPSLPYTTSVDLTDATSEISDPGECTDMGYNGPFGFGSESAWYELTPDRDTRVQIGWPLETPYGIQAAFAVFESSGGPDDLVACGAGFLGVFLHADVTYRIMVAPQGGIAAGVAIFDVREIPDPDLTFTPSPAYSGHRLTMSWTNSPDLDSCDPVGVFVRLSTDPNIVDPNSPDLLYADHGAYPGNPATIFVDLPAPAGIGPPPGVYWTYVHCADGWWLQRGPQLTIQAAGTFTPPPTSTIAEPPSQRLADGSWLILVGLAALAGAVATWHRSRPTTPA